MITQFEWRDMLRFDKMISPTIITIIYYISVIACIILGLKLIFNGMDGYMGGYQIMSGIGILLVGPLLARLWAELVIVIFKIHTRASNIDRVLSGQNPETLLPTDSILPVSIHSTQQATVAEMPPATTPYFDQNQQPRPAVVPENNYPQTPQPASPPSMQAPSQRPNLQDYWQSGIPNTTGSTIPPININLNDLRQRVPNWPLVLASIIILLGVTLPYAALVPGAGMAGGFMGAQLQDSYSITDGPLGILAPIAALAMVVISAGGLKWLWFVIGYGITVLASVFALLSDKSLFSQISKLKSSISGGLDATLGKFAPNAGQYAEQMMGSAPGVSDFLSMTFYFLIIALLFAGYWAFAGKYLEQGLMTNK